MFSPRFSTSKAYQSLLAEDFRKRVYPISYVTATFMLLAALLNMILAGNVTFAIIDFVVALLFGSMGLLVKIERIKPWIVAFMLLGAFLVLYIMTILFSGTIHGILFNYTVVPFVAFFVSGLRVGRFYSIGLLVILLLFWGSGLEGWVTISYNNLEMGMFLLSLCFGISAAWLFEYIREKAFYESYQQSLEYDALMNAIDEVYYRVNLQGIIQQIGNGISKFTDYQSYEVVGSPISVFYAIPEEREAYIEALMQYGKVTNYPITIRGKNNQNVYISMNARLANNEQGEPEFIEGIFRDVTKEVKVEKERREHFEHLQALSVVENTLAESDLELALQQVIQELKRILLADRVFLALFQRAEQKEVGYNMTFMSMGQDSNFDLESFMAEVEVRLYLASTPKQDKNLLNVVDDIEVFSPQLRQCYNLQSHTMVLLKAKPDEVWLFAIHNFKQAKKELVLDVSHRISGALNQLILQKDLEATVQRVEVASKAKGEFVATMSHELRTPLHGVVGLLDLLDLESKSFSKEQQKNLRLAQKSAHVLSSLIADVLDLSKIESGKVEIQKQAFDLKQALMDALVPFVVKAQDKGVDLSLSMQGVAAVIEGDVQHLRQVLLNLVGNAVKFTNRGYVRIVTFQDDECLQINIEDSGIGIERDKQEIVFSPFIQVHDMRVLGDNLQEKGTGLGTTISQYFVKMMGGTLTLQSEPEVGSTMSVRLPLQQVGDELVSVSMSMSELIVSPQDPEANEESSLVCPQEWRVLIAEDDPIGRRVVVKRLQRVGFSVETVADGMEAWEQIQHQDFDLLLTDVRMPGLNGIQLTETIRAFEQEQDKEPMLIIGLSAYAMEDVKYDALHCGMDDFITKPVDMQALIQILEQRCQYD